MIKVLIADWVEYTTPSVWKCAGASDQL